MIKDAYIFPFPSFNEADAFLKDGTPWLKKWPKIPKTGTRTLAQHAAYDAIEACILALQDLWDTLEPEHIWDENTGRFYTILLAIFHWIQADLASTDWPDRDDYQMMPG